MTAAVNIHATGVVLGQSGVLVSGASGAGKTTLALTLVAGFRDRGLFARLIADDRLWVSSQHGRLLCGAPEAIAGLAEARGFGPARFPHVRAAVIDLAVRLVPAALAPRLAQGAREQIAGCDVPRLDLPERDCIAAALAVEAWLAAAAMSKG